MTKPRPLTSLYKVHRVLIGTGIFGSVMTAIWGFRQWRAGQEGSPLIVAAVGLAMAIGLGFYLRYFNAKIARS